jgi:hypothetical protein
MGQDEFNSLANSIQYYLDAILNFLINRATNAHTEFLVPKSKDSEPISGVSQTLLSSCSEWKNCTHEIRMLPRNFF